jgi:hypothetical protein
MAIVVFNNKKLNAKSAAGVGVKACLYLSGPLSLSTADGNRLTRQTPQRHSFNARRNLAAIKNNCARRKKRYRWRTLWQVLGWRRVINACDPLAHSPAVW